jgi:hypothetical protein
MSVKLFDLETLEFPELLPMNSGYVIHTQTVEDYSQNQDGTHYKFKWGETYLAPCKKEANSLLDIYKLLVDLFQEQKETCSYYEIPIRIEYSDNLIKTFDEEKS